MELDENIYTFLCLALLPEFNIILRLLLLGRDHAQRLINELGEDIDAKESPSRLSDTQIAMIHNLFCIAKFDPPTGDTLSPAGEYNLRLGIIKEISPVLIATYQGSPGVFQGHSFQIEAGVSIGGKDVKAGMLSLQSDT